MGPLAHGAPMADASYRDALRLFQRETSALRDAGPTLETTGTPLEPPRVVASDVIEGTTVRQHRVFEEPVVGFSAFLDGTQQSRVVHYVDGVPVVFGRVAAVIRARVNRRMVTWKRPRTGTRLYIPRTHVYPSVWDRAVDSGFDTVDTSGESGAHPFSLVQRALEHVQRDRERVERELAEDWCASQDSPLFIDGGIASSERVAAAACVVGVIKSHRTLYVTGDAMRAVLTLPRGFRSSVIRVEAFHRTAVASWYLRVRDPAGYDPMWGLLRVETTLPSPGSAPQEVAARADLVSRWILAEAIPLALPDGRWDKMVYGIRDCEEYLKALSG